LLTQATSSFGSRVSTMKRAKMKAPTMMKNSIALANTDSRNASLSARQVSARVAKPMTIAAKALIAAPSVGENQPR